MVAVAVAAIVTGCGTSKLVNMSKYSTSGDGTLNVIEWDGYQYYSLGLLDDGSLRDTQIGYVNGDQTDKVYSVKDQNTDSWLINTYDSNGTTVNEIFEETSVTEVPDAIEAYLPTSYQISKIVDGDERYVLIDSTAAWNFTMDANNLSKISSDFLDNLGVTFDPSWVQYIGKELSVQVCDTLPSDGSDGLVKYAFVFSGNTLIKYETITDAQFDLIKNTCNTLTNDDATPVPTE